MKKPEKELMGLGKQNGWSGKSSISAQRSEAIASGPSSWKMMAVGRDWDQRISWGRDGRSTSCSRELTWQALRCAGYALYMLLIWLHKTAVHLTWCIFTTYRSGDLGDGLWHCFTTLSWAIGEYSPRNRTSTELKQWALGGEHGPTKPN